MKPSAPDQPEKTAKDHLPDLRFDFAAAARKAVKDHPEIAKNTVFINAANDDFIASPRVIKALDDDDDAFDELQKTVRTAKRLKTSFSDTIHLDQKNFIKSVVFHTEKHPLYDRSNRGIDDVGTFDHETGHVLSPEAQGTAAENIADAYAVIRHFQRFDGQETDIAYAGFKRSLQFILHGKTSHVTTFTVDKIITDRETANFVSLTPAQTAAIAKDYAQQNTRDEKHLRVLARAFRAARDKKPTEETLRRIAAITLRADPHSDVFYLGARALMLPLHEGKAQYEGRNIVLRDKAFWDIARQKMDAKMAALPAAHPLRVTAPAAARAGG